MRSSEPGRDRRGDQGRELEGTPQGDPPDPGEVLESAEESTEESTRTLQRTVEVLEAKLHRGPLPTPEDTDAYERAYPGAAKLIFDRWEKQSDHRMEIENQMVNANIRARTRGQYIGLVVAMTVIVGGFIAIYLDKSLVGLAALVLAAAAIAGRFLVTLRRRGNNNDLGAPPSQELDQAPTPRTAPK